MLDSIKQAIPNAKFSFNQYEGSGAYFTLFFISVCVLLFFYRDQGNKQLHKPYTIYYPLLAFVMIFVPFVAGPIIYVIEDVVYWRVFWIIPMTLIIALAMAVFVMRMARGRDRLLAVISCCVVIWVSGSLIVNSDNYQKPANWYKIPEDTVQICEMIREDTDGYAKVAFPAKLVSYVRQYDASILMPYGRNATRGSGNSIVHRLNSGSANVEYMKAYSAKHNINYFVARIDIPENIIDSEWYDNIGFFNDHYLFRVN